MKLTDFLNPKDIHLGVELSSKKRILELAGKLIAESLNHEYNCTEQHCFCSIECFGHLFKREKLGSTSINNGVALPHAKLPATNGILLDKPIAVFLKLETAINYEASDNKDVDLIYAIMFPEECCETYKNGLSALAKELSDKSLAKSLRAATSRDEIWQLLRYADQCINNTHPA